MSVQIFPTSGSHYLHTWSIDGGFFEHFHAWWGVHAWLHALLNFFFRDVARAVASLA